MSEIKIFHLIRRKHPKKGGVSYEGMPIIPVEELPKGHKPAKIVNSRRNGSVEGSGPAARVPRKGMMVEKDPISSRRRIKDGSRR